MLHKQIELQFGKKIKILRYDWGGEYISKPFAQFIYEIGIIHQKTQPHTPHLNGVAKRKKHLFLKMLDH